MQYNISLMYVICIQYTYYVENNMNIIGLYYKYNILNNMQYNFI